MKAVASRQTLFNRLEPSVDIERQAASRYFEALAAALAFDVAFLLERSHAKPRERTNWDDCGRQDHEREAPLPGDHACILRSAPARSCHGCVTGGGRTNDLLLGGSLASSGRPTAPICSRLRS